MSPESKLVSIIEQLEDLLKVLRNARPTNDELTDTPEDPSYPYAAGYCQGGLNNAIFDINLVVKELNAAKVQ